MSIPAGLKLSGQAFILAAFLAASPTLLFAADPAAPADSSKPAEPAIETEDDALKVMVTASRGEPQDPLTIPQSVDTITRDELDATVYEDIDDQIRRLPNVGMAPAEGNPNYWQEGFTIRGLGAQRVLTLTDGVRQAGQGIGYGGGNLSLYDMFEIERIEVVRGSSSVLYGTDAFGGVINIMTRQPKFRREFGTSGGARYVYDGQNNSNKGGAYLDFGDEGYGVVLGGSFTDAGQPNLPDDIDANSGSYSNYGAWGKADFHLTDKTKLRFMANWDHNDDVLITEDTMTLPIAVFGPPGSMDMVSSPLFFNFPEYGRSLVGAELTVDQPDETLEFYKTGVYWQRLYREFHRETAFYPTFSPGFAGPPTFVDPTASITRSTVDTDDTVDTFEWQNQARYGLDEHTVTLGFDLGMDVADQPESETQQVVAQAGIGPILGMPSTIDRTRVDARQLRAGLYAQDRWDLNPFAITPGVRLDSYSVDDDLSDFDDDEFGASGSIGTVYTLADGEPRMGGYDQSLYLNLATGFRAPDLGERFQTGIVNFGAPTQIIGQPDLDPERSWSAEIGTKGRADRFGFEAASFVNHITDYIGKTDLGIVDGFATEQYDNVGSLNLYGGEVGASYFITEQWELYGNVGRTWTNEPEKIDVASWAFNYGTKYTVPIDSGLIEDVSAAVNLRTLADSEDKTPSSSSREAFPDDAGFTVVDLQFNLNLVETSNGKGSIVTGVRNLFDQKYREPFFTLYQPERNAFVAVQWEFN